MCKNKNTELKKIKRIEKNLLSEQLASTFFCTNVIIFKMLMHDL